MNPQPVFLMSPRRSRRINPLKKPNYFFSLIRTNKLKNQTKNNSSLFHSMKFVLLLAQCFAMLPINGITGKDITSIKFKWFSFKMFYSIFAIVGCLIMMSLYAIRFFSNERKFSDIVNVTFFLSSAIVGFLFIILAKSWQTINEKWLKVEYSMRNYEYQPNLYKRFKITIIIIMVLALGEHILSVLKNINNSKECPLANTNPVKAHFGLYFSQAFALVSYNIGIVCFLEIIIILATFAWNFTDVFVILMCSAVALRFRQINKKVINAENKSESFWKEIREDYTHVTILCKALDDGICHIVTMAIGNNLFFICVQLFHTLKPFKSDIDTIYFVCSFSFLLARTAVLSAYCCWINDESKVILINLFETSSDQFGIEASRLIQQISFSPAAITGSKYFAVTRGLCLQVAGAIITFELILFQLGPVFLKTNETDKVFCVE